MFGATMCILIMGVIPAAVAGEDEIEILNITVGQPIAGACVVLNKWHIHTDPTGYFHWSLKPPVPQQVTLKVSKRYSGDYETLEATVSLSQLESEPIMLKNK